MNYPFECPKCSCYKEIMATVNDMPKDGSVKCSCGTVMNRVFTAPQVSVSKNKSYFDPSLGRVINTDHDKREAIREIEGNTGMKLEEVGNEDNSVKPKQHNWDKVVDDLARDGAFENVDSAKKSVWDD